MENWHSFKNTIDIDNITKENWQDLYSIGGWEGKGSGPGSEESVNSELVSYISDFIFKNKIASIVDFGCGDLQWVSQIFSNQLSYVGVDFTPSIINANNASFPDQTFILNDVLNITGTYEVVICKDLIHHCRNNASTYFAKMNETSSRYIILIGPTYLKNLESFRALFQQYNYKPVLDFISDEEKTIHLLTK